MNDIRPGFISRAIGESIPGFFFVEEDRFGIIKQAYNVLDDVKYSTDVARLLFQQIKIPNPDSYEVLLTREENNIIKPHQSFSIKDYFGFDVKRGDYVLVSQKLRIPVIIGRIYALGKKLIKLRTVKDDGIIHINYVDFTTYIL